MLAAVSFVLLSTGREATAAPITAGDFQSGGSLTIGAGIAVGWMFTPMTDLSVTALGMWDFHSDGLSSAHDIGIFTAGGAPVVTATIAAGLSGTFVAASYPGQDGSRFVTVPTSSLLAGVTYYILANNLVNEYSRDSVVFASQLGTVTYITGSTNSIFDSINFPEGSPNIGANFQFEVGRSAPVPEPTTLLLVGSGILTVGAWGRRRPGASDHGRLSENR